MKGCSPESSGHIRQRTSRLAAVMSCQDGYSRFKRSGLVLDTEDVRRASISKHHFAWQRQCGITVACGRALVHFVSAYIHCRRKEASIMQLAQCIVRSGRLDFQHANSKSCPTVCRFWRVWGESRPRCSHAEVCTQRSVT